MVGSGRLGLGGSPQGIACLVCFLPQSQTRTCQNVGGNYVLSILSFLTSVNTLVIQRQAEALRRIAPSSCSNSPRGHLFLFIIIYPVLSIVIFSGFYAFFNTGLHGGADLPLGVPVYILLAVLIGFWIYIGIKVFPAVFRDVLWRMRPALHYGFQDFTEGVRDSIEPHDYWVFNF